MGIFYGFYRKKKDQDIIRNFIYTFPLNILKEYHALLITSTDCKIDQLLMYAAYRQKVPTVVLVHSWDNLPARGMLSTRPTKLLVWNELMKEQAIRLHSIPEDNVKVVGVPQYEWYRKLSLDCDETSFRKRYKIPNNHIIITYTAGAKRVYPDEEFFVEELYNYILSQKKMILILRLHPEERKDYYITKYNDKPRVIISNPDNGFRANPTEDFGSEDAVKEFLSIMKYSGVIINFSSTVTLDAVLFDTPVICPCFNYNLSSNSWNFAPRWYESSHFGEISNSGAVPIVSSFEELIKEINNAINEPERLLDKRQNLRNRMMPELSTSKLIRKVVEDVIET